ncbi:MAG: serine--tRNA ligase [Candidatus Eremiobacteraeota bacterium]|nr:serine--tRNA ligase [Candidatus Eremiobacteraeota bacterium]MBC5828240.1 serine--tRNA ligase [Candidatus Eremiobacteraeota bacterium]
MVSRALLRDRPDFVRQSLARRRHDTSVVDEFLRADREWRAAISALDEDKKERNRLSAAFAAARSAEPASLESLRDASTLLSVRIKQNESAAASLERKADSVLTEMPNVLLDDVPDGADFESNVELRRVGEQTSFEFAPLPHWEIGERLGILDFARGVSLARSRFTVLRGAGARLNRALINFFLETNVAAGFTEIVPPILVNRESVRASGHLGKFADLMFSVDDGALFLSPTAEVQLVNLHRGEILESDHLPKLYTAYTPCFRQEAGAAGKDTRGLVRQHQFEKVEVVAVCSPDDAARLHQTIVDQAESLLQALGLPYRLVLLCGADTGFAARKTYDLEVWLPGQQTYREISSCSDCGDFQSRRAMIRYRADAADKPRYAATLNGSALPVGRTLLAILENYQREDGAVTVPGVLRPYMDGATAIT